MDGLFDSEFSFEYESILGVQLKLKPQDAGQIDSQMHLTLWPAATELCQVIAPYLSSARSVLELGAGTGLVGIFISKRFEGPVLITDGNKESVDLIEENIILNASHAKADVLEWGRDKHKAELIVCSDVVYSVKAIFPLLTTVRESLENGGKCVISNHCVRFSNYEKDFEETCEQLGFALKLLTSVSDANVKTFELSLI
jgi:predicted nicotinamide N-methyase